MIDKWDLAVAVCFKRQTVFRVKEVVGTEAIYMSLV